MGGTDASKSQQQNPITSPNPFQIFTNSCFHSMKHVSSAFGHGNLHSLLTTVFSSLKTRMESSFCQIKAGNPVAGGFPCARISSSLNEGSDLGRGRSTLGISMSTEDIEERLEGVPVFALCNPSDNFVLVSDSRKRGSIGFFCLGQEEANMMLDCMKSMDPPMPHGSKIVPVALSKVFQLKVDGVTFRLIPEVSQIRNAIKERKKHGGLEDERIRGVPAFQSKSLVLKSEGKRYHPIFLRKEDLEKSIRRASNPRRLPGRYFTHGDVEVVVLEDIIEAMKMEVHSDNDSNESLNDVEIEVEEPMAMGEDDVQDVDAEENPTNKLKKRNFKSKVWNFFDMLPLGPDKVLRCACKKCGQQYLASSRYGTGNMSRHLKVCKRKDTRDIGQMLIQRDSGSMGLSQGYDPQKFRELMTSAIIMHNLPFQFVEYTGIRAMLQYLYPDIDLISRNTAKADCLKMHKKERTSVKNFLSVAPGRVSLTSDLWSSIIHDGYLCLTAHFIDNKWALQKRVLSFSFMPPPHTGIALSDKIAALLVEWNIESKIFTVTLDNATSNDVSVDSLCSLLKMKGLVVCDGEFFHLRCCCHILNLVVQVGFTDIDESIKKIRDSVKYCKGSQARKYKFLECAKMVGVQSKRGLSQDVMTRWNSTFLMLDSALIYRNAFQQMATRDHGFKSCPLSEEWERVEKVHQFLKVFYDATLTFSGTAYPTANLYFPTIFPCFYELKEAMKNDNEDEYVKQMACRMWDKFQKYWSAFSDILSIACVLDPRYKLEFVDFCYNLAYCENSMEFLVVRNKLFSLFEEYRDKTSTCVKAPSFGKGGKQAKKNQDQQKHVESKILLAFDHMSSKSSDLGMKTQLELYLAEPRYSRTEEFDVLSFWKTNQYRYPELSAMARDVLAIPVSTVASESAFSVGGRVLDQYRSSLKCETVEALITTKDWMFGNTSDKIKLEQDLDEVTQNVVEPSFVENIDGNAPQSSNIIV